jgi:hypothetical protein
MDNRYWQPDLLHLDSHHPYQQYHHRLHLDILQILLDQLHLDKHQLCLQYHHRQNPDNH